MGRNRKDTVPEELQIKRKQVVRVQFLRIINIIHYGFGWTSVGKLLEDDMLYSSQKGHYLYKMQCKTMNLSSFENKYSVSLFNIPMPIVHRITTQMFYCILYVEVILFYSMHFMQTTNMFKLIFKNKYCQTRASVAWPSYEL